MTDIDPRGSAAAEARAAQRRQLWGRRRSHKLRPGQSRLLESLGRDLSALDDAASDGALDPAALFDDVDAVWLEIGFGGGEHLAALARRHPRIGFIGCEHYIDGVAKLVAAIDREGLDNVRLHAHDARDLLDALVPASLSRAYLLYPDPWPKKRHHKRRFINDETLDALARALRPGAELRIASDIEDYVRHCLAVLAARRRRGRADYEWTARGPDDWRRPWPGWRGTRYEAKAHREGRRPQYLIFRRR